MVVGIGWSSGAVRAALLARRRLGRDGCRALAHDASLAAAVTTLRDGPYGHDLGPDLTLESARWAVAATPLWHLRILAGWLPPAGGELVRTLAGWWEVLNIENLLAGMSGAETFPPYELGSLGTAWRSVRHAGSVEELRAGLAASPWMDPGADDPAAIVTWLRLSWALRLAAHSDEAADIAAGWAALVAARDLLQGGRTVVAPAIGRVHDLGRDWAEAHDVPGLAERLPREAAWVLRDIDHPQELWRADVRWWRGLSDKGRTLLRHAGSGRAAVVGAFGVLLADAHRVQGALELAARGGGEEAVIGELL